MVTGHITVSSMLLRPAIYYVQHYTMSSTIYYVQHIIVSNKILYPHLPKRSFVYLSHVNMLCLLSPYFILSPLNLRYNAHNFRNTTQSNFLNIFLTLREYGVLQKKKSNATNLCEKQKKNSVREKMKILNPPSK